MNIKHIKKGLAVFIGISVIAILINGPMIIEALNPDYS